MSGETSEEYENGTRRETGPSTGGTERSRSHVCMACGSPAQLVDDGRRAACPDCGNDWNVGPDPCERCNGDGWIWVVKTDAPCPDCTAYPEPQEGHHA